MVDRYVATEIYIRWNDHEYEINCLGSYQTEMEAIEAILKVAVYDYMINLQNDKDVVYKACVEQIRDTEPINRIKSLREICYNHIRCYAYPKFDNYESQWVWEIQKINN